MIGLYSNSLCDWSILMGLLAFEYRRLNKKCQCALLFSMIFRKKSDEIYAKIGPMEEAQRVQERKDYSYDIPSCFLSPEWSGDQKFGPSTPIVDAPSASCFLTPPSSSEKEENFRARLDSLQDLTKVNFELDDGDRESSKQKSLLRSPLHPEDRVIGRRCGEQRLDIISQLLAYGFTPICENICSYVKSQDLYRFVPGICLIVQTHYSIVGLCSLRTCMLL